MQEQVPGRGRLTFGVEEEFLLADAATRRATARADQVVAEARRILGDQAETEFYLTQLETRSRPHATARALRADLARCRRVAARAAARAGCLLVASPCAVITNRPLPIRQEERYQRIAEHLGPVLTAEDCEMSGCHIHLGSLSRAEALKVSAGLRPWLPVIQALAANSPFAAEAGHGWASRRGYLYGRWPTVGPAPALDEVGYEARVNELITAGVILDEAMLYWYARPSARYPTLEIRVADVNGDLDTTLLLAILLRALATVELAEPAFTCAASRWGIGTADLVENHLRAARYGTGARLLDFSTGLEQPLPVLVGAMLQHAAAALEALGDLPFATATAQRLLREGNGADRQCAMRSQGCSWPDLVDQLAVERVEQGDARGRRLAGAGSNAAQANQSSGRC